ncbi:MAG: tetratricopeptide repeat protein [Promethearchaeota archaeon]
MSMTAADYIEKGMKFENDQEYYEAIHCYEKALESDPRNLTAWIKIGEIHSYTNDVDKAMDIFSKLLEIDPQNRIALEYRRLFGGKC